jgi:hypothetical protein
MNALVEKVAADAGISNQQAEKAVNSVSAALKEKLPYLLHKQIDILLSGGSLSDAFKTKLDGLKDDLESSAKEFGTRAHEFTEDVGKKINDLFNGKK